MHEGKWESAEATVGFLLSYEEALAKSTLPVQVEKANGKGPMPTGSQTPKQQSSAHPGWDPPPEGWIKINVDGAFDVSGRAGIGVVIRDTAGQVLLSAWKMITVGTSAEEIEALAIREGLALASEWENKQAVVESDCLSLVNTLKENRGAKSTLCFHIMEIRQLSRSLPDVQFRAVKRERNRVAHELAQLAKRAGHSAMWRTTVPRCVQQLVAQECKLYVE